MNQAEITLKMLEQDIDNLNKVFNLLKGKYEIDYISTQEIENYLYRLRRDIDLLTYELSGLEHKHEW